MRHAVLQPPYSSSLLTPKPADYCRIDPAEKARLIVVIDTEEEFDWSHSFSRKNTSVRSMRWITRVQNIFDTYGIIPVYVIDYPVASQPDGYRPLQEIYASGRCLIGAHLHPWVNPPFEEQVNHYHSFVGNLPPSLEAMKLHVLSETIGEQFDVCPVIYKAGRYGVGPHTADILEGQGYEVDLSVCPLMDYSSEGGPDFGHLSAWPYWFGEHRSLLELPLTVGYTGLFRRWGCRLHQIACHPPLCQLHAAGILSRLRCVDKAWLSPEGYSLVDNMKLLRALYGDGLRIFSFAFHSPSVEPGNTPYVTSQHDLERFLSHCGDFFEYFMGELGGTPTTPLALKAQLTGATHMCVLEGT
jgi:hypothetical protein